MRLTLPELAIRLGVSETSIWGWETGKSMPLVSVYPNIILFLGYAPFPIENLTFGERLSTARCIAGITRKELARMMRMGAETLQDIENTNCIPKAKILCKLQPFIEQQFVRLEKLYE
jgi:transcriptional regulator with XRE-family HTH domain